MVDFDAIHTFSSQHRSLLELSKRAGCFYCCQIFAPSEITAWVDGPQVATEKTSDGITALCPRCGIDAVLPSVSYYPLTEALLADMPRHWFEK
jgi:hypothetical protein